MGFTGKNSANKFHKVLKACASSGAVAWALMSGMTALAGPDACVVSTNSAECTGDQSAGIFYDYGSGIDNLTVRNLTGDITPAGNLPGIGLHSNNSVNLFSDLGGHSIFTSGYFSGIDAVSRYGSVSVQHTGNITTTGDNASAVRGVSAATLPSSITLIVNGGTLSTAGTRAYGISAYAYNGSVIDIYNAADILTSGVNGHGIFGTTDGAITIDNFGDITTTGSLSNGIYAGNGYGELLTITNAGAISTATRYSRGIQADGSGIHNITNSGIISTLGDNAEAIYSVSQHNATVTNTAALSTSGLEAIAIKNLSLLNASTTTNSGDITTAGTRAIGISTFSRDGENHTTNSGAITTGGQEANGIYAESTASNLFLTNSGTISTSGMSAVGIHSIAHAGNLTYTNTGAISTTGDYAHATIIAGPMGDMNLDLGGSFTTTGQEASAVYVAAGNGLLNANFTGEATASGAGSRGVRFESQRSLYDVNFASTSSVFTSGTYATGVFASNDGAHTSGGMNNITLGGSVRTTGDNSPAYDAYFYNSDLTTTLSGSLQASGAYSEAARVFVSNGNSVWTQTGSIQSTSGSGNALHITTTGGGTNTVDIQADGAISATGSGSNGVLIESDGVVSFTNAGGITTSGGAGTALRMRDSGTQAYVWDIDNSGSLIANGANAYGIDIAQTGALTLVNTGTIQGGSGTGWGIQSLSPGGAYIENRGTISALSGQALRLGAGNDTVSNFGTIEGDVDLGAGVNAFTNEATGILILGSDFTVNGTFGAAGEAAKVAVGGELSNNGTIYFFGDGLIGASTIDGNFYQSETGTLIFDADASTYTTDTLFITGAAELRGQVVLNLHNVPTTLATAPDFPNDIYSFAIITANPLTLDAGLTFNPSELTIENTVAYTFALRTDGTRIFVDVLEAISNFEDMLNPLATTYQKGFATYLDRQMGAPDTTGISDLTDALRMLPDATALQASFNAFAPYAVATQDRILRDDARELLNTAPGCEASAEAGLCLVGGVRYGETSGDLNSFSTEYETDRTSFDVGLGVALSESWRLGATARVNSDEFHLPGDANADQDGFMLAAGVSGDVFKGVNLAVTGLVGNATADLSRASLLSSANRLTGSLEARVQGISASVAYPFAAGGWTLTPALGASTVCIDGESYSERGGQADAIAVDEHDSCQRAYGPRLDVKTPSFAIGPFTASGFAQLGFEAIDDDALVVTAALLGAGLPDDRFETVFEGDGDSRTSALIGLEGVTEGGWTIRAGAGFSETDVHSVWTAGLTFARSL